MKTKFVLLAGAVALAAAVMPHPAHAGGLSFGISIGHPPPPPVYVAPPVCPPAPPVVYYPPRPAGFYLHFGHPRHGHRHHHSYYHHRHHPRHGIKGYVVPHHKGPRHGHGHGRGRGHGRHR